MGDDLRELGETSGKHRIYRAMRQEKLRSPTGYHRRPSACGGMASVFAPNHLNWQFDVAEPNQVWYEDLRNSARFRTSCTISAAPLSTSKPRWTRYSNSLSVAGNTAPPSPEPVR
jgi:hypothetical protein